MGRKCMFASCGRPVVPGSSYCDIHKNSAGPSPRVAGKKTTSAKKAGDPKKAAGK